MADAALFRRYQRAADAVADLAQEAVREMLSAIDGMTADQAADWIISNYPRIVREYGSAAAEVARDYYQEARGESQSTDGYEPQAAGPVEESWALEDVQGVEGHVDELPGRAVARVLQRMDQTIRLNGSRDRASASWAVVPRPGACEFCIMTASNGWHRLGTRSRPNAHRHDNCRCTLAVDFTGSPSLEGYDPEALRELWWRMEGIDTREDLTHAEREMLKLAASDAVMPLDLAGSRRLADMFDACLADRRARFLAELTQESYDATMGSILREIGEQYGMEIAGECLVGPGLYSAVPNGDEVWALTRLHDTFTSAQFLGTDRRRRKGNPDLLIDGSYIDIKTPDRLDRVVKRLNLADRQCLNRGQQAGVAILSSLRVDGTYEQCLQKTDGWLDDHEDATVFVVGSDSTSKRKGE